MSNPCRQSGFAIAMLNIVIACLVALVLFLIYLGHAQRAQEAVDAHWAQIEAQVDSKIAAQWDTRENTAGSKEERALVAWLRGKMEGRDCMQGHATPAKTSLSDQRIAQVLLTYKTQGSQACLRQQIGQQIAQDKNSSALPVMFAFLDTP